MLIILAISGLSIIIKIFSHIFSNLPLFEFADVIFIFLVLSGCICFGFLLLIVEHFIE